MVDWSAPIGRLDSRPLDGPGLAERLRLTAFSLGYALAGAPALVLLVLTLVSVPLGVVGAGVLIALGAVPATQALTSVHRRVSGSLLGATVPAQYADLRAVPVPLRPFRWLREPERWRDVAFLAFSGTGGLVLSALPPALLAGPFTYLALAVLDPGWVWLLLTMLGGPLLAVWWLVTPALVRTRAQVDRVILDRSGLAGLQRRVAQVEESRAASLDHSAAEIRRIERDLHDGAQARIAAVGMDVGLAEKLLRSDPEAAADLLRGARETTLAALEDLRGVVRGILPPVLADRGLAGGVEALAVALPLPVEVGFEVPRLPAPVESATYFAVAECLANVVKHSGATRASIRGGHDGRLLVVEVRDDGRGGADPAGSGLAGVARRLGAFDGTMDVVSPAGGPTTITLEVPCRP